MNTQIFRPPATVAAALVLFLIGITANTHARPPIRDAFFQVYSNAVGSKLDNLTGKPGHYGVCHCIRAVRAFL